MDAISQSVIVVLCFVGVTYAIWMMWKCFQQKRPVKEQEGHLSRSARRTARVDRVLEFFGSAALLAVAGTILMSCAPRLLIKIRRNRNGPVFIGRRVSKEFLPEGSPLTPLFPVTPSSAPT